MTGCACLGSTSRPTSTAAGSATSTVGELLDWGASRGARTAWLHVESDNEAGLALYERLGFGTHHLNRYLVGPRTSGADDG